MAVVGLKRLDHLIFEHLTVGEVEARHGNSVFLLHNNGQRVWAVPYPMSVPYPMGGDKDGLLRGEVKRETT